MRKVDFICIGATKAGTTSFYHYIKSHPQLFLSPRKELHFFDEPAVFHSGWETFYNENFSKAGADKKVGYQSPRYLRDPDVPRKIAAHNPDVRIFILLRNPIQRAFSHYKMLFRLEREKRSFAQLVTDQLAEKNLEACRTTPLEGEFSLLTQGEYGRILKDYLKYFKREQILILFTEELEAHPQRVIDQFCDFMGIERFTPPNLNQKYHVGGDKARFKWVIPFLQKLYFPRLLWKLLSSETRSRIILWNNTKLKVSPKQSIFLQPAEKSKLKEFYKKDVKLLEDSLGVNVPWNDFKI